jgi:hypothetical protein
MTLLKIAKLRCANYQTGSSWLGVDLHPKTPVLRSNFFSDGDAISQDARKLMARPADAPDLGIPNRRFQNIAFRFKEKSFYEKKSRISRKAEPNTKGK